MPVCRHTIMTLVLLGFSVLTGCSDDPGKKEKSTIDQVTNTAAKGAIESIKTPLEQARTAAEQEDSHNRQVQEQANKQ